MMESLSTPLVVVLSGAQNHRCPYCLLVMELRTTPESPLELFHATIEHVMPRSERGADTVDNLVAACYFCNTLRGGSNVHWFSSFLERFLRKTGLREHWHQLPPETRRRIFKIKDRAELRHLRRIAIAANRARTIEAQ